MQHGRTARVVTYDSHQPLCPYPAMIRAYMFCTQDMSVQQMLQLATACPRLQLIDTMGCPPDSPLGRTRRAVHQDVLQRVLSGKLDLV